MYVSQFVVFSIGFCVLSSSDLMQRFGSLPIRARTTRFLERPKKSFVDSFKDSGLRQGLSRFCSFGVLGTSSGIFRFRLSKFWVWIFGLASGGRCGSCLPSCQEKFLKFCTGVFHSEAGLNTV